MKRKGCSSWCEIWKTRNNQTFAAFTAVQTYAYDALNRLKSATENIDGNQTPNWKQTFTYDRYGNRRFDEANTTTLAQNCPTAVCNPQVDPDTNKLIGYTFDASGNTKIDAENRQFIYDGENKQIEVKDSNNVTIGKYFYDGDGKRVKKISATETTVFIYNASGQLVAEYSTQIAQAQDAKVSYLTNDHLGSPRITTDQNGQVVSRRDFQPFGEEITRASYGTDLVRQKFTGYLRDGETELDFAQARMYANKLGRFNTVDPIFIEKTRLIDPQAINLYVYTRNNPLIYIDPDGKMFVDGDGNLINVNDDLEVSCEKCNKKSKQYKSLVRLAGLLKASGSKVALKKFNDLKNSKGKVQIIIGKGFANVNGALHQPKGRFYDKEGKVTDKEGFLEYDFNEAGFNGVANTIEGEDVYEEALITFDLKDLKKQFKKFKEDWKIPDMTFGEFIISNFNHEAKHNLDPKQVSAYKKGEKGFYNEEGSEENTKSFIKELKEIKASRKKN